MASRPFTSEQARQLRFVRDAGFTAAGQHVCYTVAAIDQDLRERSTLWLHDLDSSKARRIEADLADPAGPAPAPDGSAIAVLADVAGQRQIVLVQAGGGQPRTLTALRQGVAGAPAWSPDSRSIAFTAGPEQVRDPSLPYWVDRVTYRSDGLGYLDDVVTDLYCVDVETGSVRRLTDDRCMNSEPRWSPDGRMLAYLVSFPPDREWNWLPELHVLDIGNGGSRVAVDASWGGAYTAEWCPDGDRIAFVGAPVGQTLISVQQEVDVWIVDAAGGVPRCRSANVQGRPGQAGARQRPAGDPRAVHAAYPHARRSRLCRRSGRGAGGHLPGGA